MLVLKIILKGHTDMHLTYRAVAIKAQCTQIEKLHQFLNEIEEISSELNEKFMTFC